MLRDCGQRTYQFTQGKLQVEAFDERLDMSSTLRTVILFAEFERVRPQYLLCALPLQHIFLFTSVVEQMHSQSHIYRHGLERLLTSLAVDHVVSKVPLIFEIFQAAVWQLS